MSAQLSQHLSTRVLIAEKSENCAYALDSTLRDAGIATKLTISDDLAHIAQLITQGDVDIALLTDKVEGLEQIIPRIRKSAPHVPIILLTNPDETSWVTADALALGITDVVQVNQSAQVGLVVKRELEHVCQREHFSHVRRALKEAEQRCQLLLQGSKSAIAYVHEGMHIHANEHYLKMFGYNDIDDLCAESLIDILAEASAAVLKTHLKTLRNGTAEVTFNFASKPVGDSEDGPVVQGTMELANSQYEGEDCLQITVRQEQGDSEDSTNQPATPTAEEQASTPSALELPGFLKSAEAHFSSETDDAYILVASLDNYKELQRAYGLVGAETICRRTWQGIVEIAANYPLTRLANHQFAIAITGSTHEKALDIANNVREGVSELIFEVHDKTVRPTVSISGEGVEEDEGVGKALDTAYAYMEEMLDAGKANSAYLPVAEDDSTPSESDNARVILRQITEAIEKKNFMLLFQPIISLRGDSDEHYEVFLRMTDSNDAQIEPGHFLQTAIDNNVAGKIDRWVILQSIKMLSVHRAKGHTTRLTINLTCNSVTDGEFLQWLGVAIKAARLPSDAVIFQVTEKDATTYLRQTREFVEGLRAMHCRASLSRFGLIEDPFETLRHLPVDMVKLDGTCIEKLEETEGKTQALIASIKKLQGAGKLTVVPMVENANVLSTLWQAGANYIQGHYLQEPSIGMDYDFSTEE